MSEKRSWRYGDPLPEGGPTIEMARAVKEADERLVAIVWGLVKALGAAPESKDLHEAQARAALGAVVGALVEHACGNAEVEEAYNEAMNKISYALGMAYGHGVFDANPTQPGHA